MSAPHERRSRRRRYRPIASAIAWSLTATACGASPSILDPKGPGARRIVDVWWFMFGVSAFVVIVVVALIVAAVVRRSRAGTAADGEPGWSRLLVIGGGVAFPLVVLSVLWALSLRDTVALSEPADDASLTVEVVGRRWWWEVRYPEHGIVTANEIHIPVGERVDLLLGSADVIHSFWVPELQLKTDMIPGRENRMWIEADEPGIYRGQCAEFCGLQHANMVFFVVAESPDEHRKWLAQESATPSEPADPVLARGREVLESTACAECHTVRGTQADGTLGPDLTHFGSRLTIGAGTVPNTRGYLGGWIVDSQTIKPGNLMPPIQLPPEDLQALIAYLESLV